MFVLYNYPCLPPRYALFKYLDKMIDTMVDKFPRSILIEFERQHKSNDDNEYLYNREEKVQVNYMCSYSLFYYHHMACENEHKENEKKKMKIC